jgi:hypothetical protein
MTIAPIKDVTHLPSPAPGHLAQELLLLDALLPCDTLLALPPAHAHHLGDAIAPDQH